MKETDRWYVWYVMFYTVVQLQIKLIRKKIYDTTE